MPGYLLDTNIVSETRKPRINEGVAAFFQAQPARSLFLSVLTIGELRKGVAMTRRSHKAFAEQLSAWIDTIETTFVDRILHIDTEVVRRWGELAADRTRPVIDTLLAATALVHGLTLVTRDTAALRGINVAVFNPFAEPYLP